MNDAEKRLCGLNYARSLNFTDAQYEEALKRINSPDNANQLLVALIDVSSRDNQAAKDTNKIETDNQQPDSSNYTANSTDNASKTIDIPSVSNTDYQHQTNPVKSTSIDGSASSLSTSCYSSITSLPSSSDHSLDSITRQQGNQCSSQDSACSLRKIFIDGSNVARTHGKDKVFSWTGVKLCVDWFMSRDHKVVKVLVPSDKCFPQCSTDEAILNYLIETDILIKTPSGCNDDLFIIEAARQSNGIIVSNDRFRDEKRFNDELDKYIFLNRLPYIFVDDLFIPANDPRGRNGPNLTEFLWESEDSSQNHPNNSTHSKLMRTKSHQRYQRNAVYYKRANQSNSLYHRSIQTTKSLPLDQTRSSTMFANQQQLALGDQQTMIQNNSTMNQQRSQQMISVQHSLYRNHQDDRNIDRQARKSMSVTYGHNQSRTQLLANSGQFRQSFSGGGGGGGDPLRRSIM